MVDLHRDVVRRHAAARVANIVVAEVSTAIRPLLQRIGVVGVGEAIYIKLSQRVHPALGDDWRGKRCTVEIAVCVWPGRGKWVIQAIRDSRIVRAAAANLGSPVKSPFLSAAVGTVRTLFCR